MPMNHNNKQHGTITPVQKWQAYLGSNQQSSNSTSHQINKKTMPGTAKLANRSVVVKSFTSTWLLEKSQPLIY